MRHQNSYRTPDYNRSDDGFNKNTNFNGGSFGGPLLKFERIMDNQYSFTDEERYLFRLISQIKVFELREFLDRSPPMNLTNLIDSSGYTPLHLAVYKNSMTMAQMLAEYVN